MPDALLATVGCALVALAFLDALWTTLAPRGAGPLAKALARAWWQAALWTHRQTGWQWPLSTAGPSLLVLALVAWVGLLWAGWLCLFSLDPASVVTATDQRPASLAGRVYYVGFVLFTLGTGDYEPVGPLWEVLSAVASLSGLFLVTLSITYVLSVVSAVAKKRALAGSIHSLGTTPGGVLARAWDGAGFAGLDLHLVSLASELERHTQRHLAYPIVHYFYSRTPRTALGVAVATLDEALLLAGCVARPGRLPPAVLGPARQTVESFLDTLREDYVRPARAAPPPPDRRALASAGVPLDDAALDEAVQEAAERRALLAGFVADSGRRWDDVTRLLG